MPHVEFSSNHIVEGLPEHLCKSLYAAGKIERLPSGSVIVDEGADLNRLYVILEGQVEAYLPGGGERISEVCLTRLGPGDCFGEYAFVDQLPASAAIRTLSDVEVYSIADEELRAFLDAHHTAAFIVYENLLQILVRRLRDTNAELDLFTLSF